MSLTRNAFKRLHNLENMMAERGIAVDHSTLHRWVIRMVPLLNKAFRRHKRSVGSRWHMDETYIKIKGHWKYLYRAVDTAGQTIDFLLNRPGFFGEFLVRKLRLPDHYLHWKHNRLFRLLPAVCGLAVQVTFDY